MTLRFFQMCTEKEDFEAIDKDKSFILIFIIFNNMKKKPKVKLSNIHSG
jgi:hypothetical protein